MELRARRGRGAWSPLLRTSQRGRIPGARTAGAPDLRFRRSATRSGAVCPAVAGRVLGHVLAPCRPDPLPLFVLGNRGRARLRAWCGTRAESVTAGGYGRSMTAEQL